MSKCTNMATLTLQEEEEWALYNSTQQTASWSLTELYINVNSQITACAKVTT